ncbi:MAG: endonuclease [Acidobacteria bacterium]|nr:endonuclease [Acidobacteriota bacterium]
MRYKDIRRFLKPYSMVASRTTTISHAFAASIAPCDSFEDATVRMALSVLGQDPDAELECAYCCARAETWDHVHATVQDKKFSGYGHRLGNLLPCCKPCNSKKGNKNWLTYLRSLPITETLRAERERRINDYLTEYGAKDVIPDHLPEYEQLQELRRRVLELFREADELASIVRKKSEVLK